MNENISDEQFKRLAEELAARHRTPKSLVTHPTGVIVPGDEFMTEKLKDPDYVPYCSKCEPAYRVRRMSYGFRCPNCGNRMNYDLTHYNNNVNVSYEGQPLSIGAWNAEVERKKAAKKRKSS